MKSGLVLSSPCNQRAPSIIPLNILLAYLCSVPHPSFSYNENVLFSFFPSGGAPRCSYRVERSGLFSCSYAPRPCATLQNPYNPHTLSSAPSNTERPWRTGWLTGEEDSIMLRSEAEHVFFDCRIHKPHSNIPTGVLLGIPNSCQQAM